MKVSVEKLEGSRVSLEVKTPRQEVDEALERAFRRLVKQVNIPGFRRGKAPRTVFERFYGKESLVEEALRELLPREYDKAVEETHIEPVDEPEFKDANVDEEGLTFKAVVYVKPEVKLEGYNELKIPFESPKEVTDEDVQKQVEQLRERMAELVPLSPDVPLESGNYATIHVKAVEGGDVKSTLDTDLSYYQVGSENPLLPGLGKALVGMKKGEVKQFDSRFKIGKTDGEQKSDESGEPKENEPVADDNENSRAETDGTNSDAAASDLTKAAEEKEVSVRLEVEVKEAYVKKLPENDEDLAKSLGKTSIDEVREDIKKSLTNLRLSVARDQYLRKVEEELGKMAEIETIPEAMIQRRADELLQRFQNRLAESGTDLENYLAAAKQTPEELMNQIRKDAETDVRNDLILDYIVEKEKIEAPETRVNSVVEAIAKEMGRDEKTVRTTLEIRGGLEDIKRQISRMEALEKVAKEAAKNAGTEFPEDPEDKEQEVAAQTSSEEVTGNVNEGETGKDQNEE